MNISARGNETNLTGKSLARDAVVQLNTITVRVTSTNQYPLVARKCLPLRKSILRPKCDLEVSLGDTTKPP